MNDLSQQREEVSKQFLNLLETQEDENRYSSSEELQSMAVDILLAIGNKDQSIILYERTFYEYENLSFYCNLISTLIFEDLKIRNLGFYLHRDESERSIKIIAMNLKNVGRHMMSQI